MYLDYTQRRLTMRCSGGREAMFSSASECLTRPRWTLR